jgi:hypothetical protein
MGAAHDLEGGPEFTTRVVLRKFVENKPTCTFSDGHHAMIRVSDYLATTAKGLRHDIEGGPELTTRGVGFCKVVDHKSTHTFSDGPTAMIAVSDYLSTIAKGLRAPRSQGYTAPEVASHAKLTDFRGKFSPADAICVART